ncbi:MAG TPA: hypothetical protein PK264_16525, partial [Hyphomicrobiaceae bacterium]|nr:hypothetical protein [Hyphomicrobiaceae bacterium]
LVMVFVMALGLPLKDPGENALPTPKTPEYVKLAALAPANDPPLQPFRRPPPDPKPEEKKPGFVAPPPPGVEGDLARPDRVSRCFSVEGDKLTWYMDTRIGETARVPPNAPFPRNPLPHCGTARIGAGVAPSGPDRDGGAEHGLQFPDYRWELTVAGQRCLVEICGALLDKVAAERDRLKYVLIEGHTSSGWRDPASCRPMARAATAADKKLAADACNRELSVKRAMTAFEFCRGYNLTERQLSEEEFAARFRTDGRGSLDVRMDRDTGREDPIASRRVEFVFVRTDAGRHAAK